MPSRLPATTGRPVAALLLLLALAGCASDSMARRTPREPRPTLTGRQDFFDGRITAEVKIGEMTRPLRAEGASARGESPDGRRRPPGGFGGGMGGGPGRPTQGGEGGEDRMGPRPAVGQRQSGPPVLIHLRFTNHGPEPVELHIADFLSPLGNFVVQPATLAIAPGATVAAEPLTSSLARQTAGGDITLKLRVGDHTETRTVPLEIEAAPRPENGKSGQTL